jgi:YbgC/YbaW family acyl-CoA thioester hydrolase
MIYLHRTTFDEMDFARVTFFGRHFYWMEHATTAWLVERGIGFATLDRDYGFGFPIISAEAKYRAPVRLEQTVEVRLALRDLTRKGFTTPFEIVRQDDGVLAAYGAITRRVVDVRKFRGVEAPDDLYAKLVEMRDESAAMAFPHVGPATDDA